MNGQPEVGKSRMTAGAQDQMCNSDGQTKEPYDNLALRAIFQRRSNSRLSGPGPGQAEILTLLNAGAAAPDHGTLRPFRFMVLQEKSKERLSEVFVSLARRRAEQADTTLTPGQIEKERSRLYRAPLVIVVVARTDPSSHIPVLEQVCAAAAAAENILLASTALGFGSMWRTGVVSYEKEVLAGLGLSEEDQIIAWLYIGSVKPQDHALRTPPSLEGIASFLD